MTDQQPTAPTKFTKPVKIAIGIGVVITLLFWIFIIVAIMNAPKIEKHSRSSPSQQQPVADAGRPTSEFDLIVQKIVKEAKESRFADSSLCAASYSTDSSKYLDESHIADGMTNVFIESGKEVFKDAACSTFMLSIDVEGVDARGNDGKFRFATFTAERAKFEAYKWDTLKDESIGEQLKADGILAIPLWSSVKPEAFRY
jgi:hypothetical protein